MWRAASTMGVFYTIRQEQPYAAKMIKEEESSRGDEKMAEDKTIEAIYEDGVFKPLKPLKGLAEHERVRLTIEPADEDEGYTAQVEAFLAECDRVAEAIKGEFDSAQELRQLREERASRR